MEVLVTRSCLTVCVPMDCPRLAPLSMSGLPFPSPWELPNPGIGPWSPALQADSLPSEPQGKPWGKNKMELRKKSKF